MTDSRPLAERMRPTRLSDYVSQSHLVGEAGALRLQIEHRKDNFSLYHS